MTDAEQKSIEWARKNKKQYTKEFLANTDYALHQERLAIFMAGSPGAGKTEYSSELVENFDKRPLLIDPDKFREDFEAYTGNNSSEVQAGVGILVDNLFDEITKKGYSFILDGTFNHDKALANVTRCISKKYAVQIHYLFQKPEVAWRLTQDREIVEGRGIDKEVFIEHFCGSINKVREAIDKFGDDIKVVVVERDYNDDFQSIHVNEKNIERYLPKSYNKRGLKKLLS